MPRCKYNNCVNLLPCNQLHTGTGDKALTGGCALGYPLELPLGSRNIIGCRMTIGSIVELRLLRWGPSYTYCCRTFYVCVRNRLFSRPY